MDLTKNLNSYLKPTDDFILLGSTQIERFDFVHSSVRSFHVIEKNLAPVQELQKSKIHAFHVQDVDDALDFFIEEVDETKLQNMFVYVNPFVSLMEKKFYQQVEFLLTGRSFYSFDFHLTLLGQKSSSAVRNEDRLLHLKDGLSFLDRSEFNAAEQHLYQILDEVTR